MQASIRILLPADLPTILPITIHHFPEPSLQLSTRLIGTAILFIKTLAGTGTSSQLV
jgi:hypothetical protein